MSEEAWRGEATNTAWRERIGRAGACREVREAAMLGEWESGKGEGPRVFSAPLGAPSPTFLSGYKTSGDPLFSLFL